MARHLIITGRVQGVGFRYSLQREALRLGLTGWVRNREDGTVEAMINGTTEAMTALIAWAHRGPPAARVDKVHDAAANDKGAVFAGFEQRPTA